MNQIKIGEFIASRRKELELTQRQLSEQLGISDKTISKWECGRGLPEVSLMLPLCGQLQISVNELLSGEKLSPEKYHEKAEENMMNLVKEKAESKKKIILSGIVAMTCVIAALVLILVAGAVLLSVIGIGVAVVLDKDAGTYECPECYSRFVPSIGAYMKGLHTLTKRHLKCPACGKSSFCRRRLTRG